MRSSSLRPLAAASALAFLAACGGGGSTTAPSGPGTGSTTPTPTPTATPEPTPTPVQGPPPLLPSLEACPIGVGVYYTTCNRTNPLLLGDVESAIDESVNDYPTMFDQDDVAGPGGFRVLDPDGFVTAVVGNLRRAGFCADYDGAEVQVKNTNDFSEQYDILLSSEHIRRGNGAYRSTCNPAAFPVNPAQAIAAIRVAFYAMACPETVTTLPGLNTGVLYVGCVGNATATPKDALGEDVPARIHGPDIEWEVRRGEGDIVEVNDVRDQPFNKRIRGLQPGDFQVCATVQGVEGCLNGRVE
jgi:hypothetical protein